MTLHDRFPTPGTKLGHQLAGRLNRRGALKRVSLLGLGTASAAGLMPKAPARAAALPAHQEGSPVRGGSVRAGVAASAGGFDPALCTTMEEIYVALSNRPQGFRAPPLRYLDPRRAWPDR